MELTTSQMRFLAERLACKSDIEAAQKLNIGDDMPSRWKRDPEFLAQYEKLFTDGIELAKLIARRHLAKAMFTLIEAAEAKHTTKAGGSEAQWDARIAAARSILAVHKISTTSSSVAGDAENPITLTINADELFKAVKERTKKPKDAVPQ